MTRSRPVCRGSDLVDIASEARPCLLHTLNGIGEDTAERLDIVLAPFPMLVGHRAKYAGRTCEDRTGGSSRGAT